MQIASPKRGKGRPIGWSPSLLKEHLRKRVTSLRQTLIELSIPGGCGWRGLYGDVCGWREYDKELDQLINSVRDDVSRRGGNHGGRPRNDADDLDWQQRFCEEYATKRSRNQAALVTPYKPTEIAKFLSPRYKEFDQSFADKVHAVEIQLAGRAEELVWDSLEQSANGGSPKDTAWIGINVLKNLPSSGWGSQRVDVNVSGTITNKFEINRERLVAEIISDQQDYFKRNSKQLASENPIDVEVVEE